MFTLAMPQSEPARDEEPLGLAHVVGEDAGRQALRHVVVHRDRLVELVDSRITYRIGAKVSSRTTSACSGISHDRRADVVRVGMPSASTRSPPVDLAAFGRAPARAPPASRSKAASSISGPTSVAVLAADRRSGAARTPASAASTQLVVDRRRARSAGAATGAALAGRADGAEQDRARAPDRGRRDGATIIALLPPSSSSERPNRAATTGATRAAHARRAGGARPAARAGSSASASPTSRAADARPGAGRPARRRTSSRGALEQRLAGERGERRLLRRLPDHGVAAHERERGVPAPRPRPGS